MTLRKPASPSSSRSSRLDGPNTPPSPHKPLPSLPIDSDDSFMFEQNSGSTDHTIGVPSVWTQEKNLRGRADHPESQQLRSNGPDKSTQRSFDQQQVIASEADITPRTSSESQVPSHERTASPPPPNHISSKPESKQDSSSSNPFRGYQSRDSGEGLIQDKSDEGIQRENSRESLDVSKNGNHILGGDLRAELEDQLSSDSTKSQVTAQDPSSENEISTAPPASQRSSELGKPNMSPNQNHDQENAKNANHEKPPESAVNASEVDGQPLNPTLTPGLPSRTGPNIAGCFAIPTQSDGSSKGRRASETYQIRLVNWYDASSPKNPRRSPIMVQNANGPCPLLALVNALILSTPSNLASVLVETLRVREQVSLGLLLDAVIDELMSGRRGDTAQNLPDVSELYAFLVTLHAGMNVNPRFIAVEDKPMNLMDAPIDMPINLNNLRKPGGFEETKEMSLYSSFAIPLIHGWIPPRSHPAFTALERTARTYEDAQNIMFREEELEIKLKRQGLGAEEQVMLEDIGSLKYFLSSTATQLTGYGLDTITESLAPGTIAILFRNDHFSTVYRHPKSGQLFTLVTDMGYAGHDEVVWESLVDVSGEGCEFFAGDFRPVGNVVGDTQLQSHSTAQSGQDGWETVKRKQRNGPHASQQGDSHIQMPSSDLPTVEHLQLGKNDTKTVSSSTEQEDHDLALAMQLQEEEEERSRRDVAARRREDELSRAYLDNADASGRRTFPGFARGSGGRVGAPNVPPRGNRGNCSGRGGAASMPSRTAPETTRQQSSCEDAPPPSYEQAAKNPAYHPPVNHPAHPHALPNQTGKHAQSPRPQGGRNRGSSAYSEHNAAYPGYPSTSHDQPRVSGNRRTRTSTGAGQLDGAPGVVRRRSDMVASAIEDGDRGRDKECVIM